jgi:hypothetical protein
MVHHDRDVRFVPKADMGVHSCLPSLRTDARGVELADNLKGRRRLSNTQTGFFDIEKWKAFETERSLRPAPPAFLLIK